MAERFWNVPFFCTPTLRYPCVAKTSETSSLLPTSTMVKPRSSIAFFVKAVSSATRNFKGNRFSIATILSGNAASRFWQKTSRCPTRESRSTLSIRLVTPTLAVKSSEFFKWRTEQCCWSMQPKDQCRRLDSFYKRLWTSASDRSLSSTKLTSRTRDPQPR